MIRTITYGIGGHCEKCSDKHEHPLHNIISDVEIPDEESTPNDNPKPT